MNEIEEVRLLAAFAEVSQAVVNLADAVLSNGAKPAQSCQNTIRVLRFHVF